MTDSRKGEKPKFKAILIGGPCDGETYGIFEERSTVMAIDYSSLPYAFLDPAIKPDEFGPKPTIALYELRHIAGIPETQKSRVRTYFFSKLVQNTYD